MQRPRTLVPGYLSSHSVLSSYVKNVAANVAFVHCFSHRFELCTKALPSELMSCLNKIVKIVNVIKTSALNSRLCQGSKDVCSEHKCLLFHTQLRWRSLGNMIRRVFELRHELFTFFKKKNYEFKDDLKNNEFILWLAYLSDIFQALNLINLSFQG